MRRVFSVAAACLLIATLLCSCAPDPLPEGYDEQTVVDAAKNFVTLINDKDYEGAAALFNTDVMGDFGAAELEQSLSDYMEDLGAFESFRSAIAYGSENEDTGQQYGSCVVLAKYASGNYGQFTVTFDLDMKVVGIYVR